MFPSRDVLVFGEGISACSRPHPKVEAAVSKGGFGLLPVVRTDGGEAPWGVHGAVLRAWPPGCRPFADKLDK